MHPTRLLALLIPATLAFLLLSGFLFLRGCMNEHSRPIGHGDMTVDVSPDGTRLVFNAVGRGGRDLYLLDLATRRVSRIAETPEYETDPSFAPDGRSIVYTAGGPGERADHIFIRSLDGGRATQLTDEDANDTAPEFSPDGKRILFTRDTDYHWGGLAANWSGGGRLQVMDADGSNVRQIGDGSFAMEPHFSPDGEQILYLGLQGLHTIPASGQGAARRVDIPPRPGPPQGAVYSPDGLSIAFSMGATGPYEGDYDIFLMDLSGRSPLRLTRSPEGCFRPQFMPDGRSLLHHVIGWPNGPTGYPKHSLWTVGLDGSAPRRFAGPDLFDDPLQARVD